MSQSISVPLVAATLVRIAICWVEQCRFTNAMKFTSKSGFPSKLSGTTYRFFSTHEHTISPPFTARESDNSGAIGTILLTVSIIRACAIWAINRWSADAMMFSINHPFTCTIRVQYRNTMFVMRLTIASPNIRTISAPNCWLIATVKFAVKVTFGNTVRVIRPDLNFTVHRHFDFAVHVFVLLFSPSILS